MPTSADYLAPPCARITVPDCLDRTPDGDKSFRKNQHLHEVLKTRKNDISTIANWPTLKRLTNEYELVCGADAGGVSRMTPISRSYFKMWEMLQEYLPSDVVHQPEPLMCAFLAEGPGGFIESVATMRSGICQTDRLHCITLVQRGAPGWNQLHSRRWLRANSDRCLMHMGQDGTGDLYNMSNIDHFVASVGSGTCHLVTADGGFDVSNNYDMQEQMSFQLQLCETYAAMSLQRPGGMFVLKVFDICDTRTISLLWMITRLYETVKIVKPLTSRPANSEKYIVCTGYRPNSELLIEMREHVVNGDMPAVFPDKFIDQVYQYNLRYIFRQIKHIEKTTRLSHYNVVPRFPRPHQVRLAIEWCHRHHILTKIR